MFSAGGDGGYTVSAGGCSDSRSLSLRPCLHRGAKGARLDAGDHARDDRVGARRRPDGPAAPRAARLLRSDPQAARRSAPPIPRFGTRWRALLALLKADARVARIRTAVRRRSARSDLSSRATRTALARVVELKHRSSARSRSSSRRAPGGCTRRFAGWCARAALEVVAAGSLALNHDFVEVAKRDLHARRAGHPARWWRCSCSWHSARWWRLSCRSASGCSP